MSSFPRYAAAASADDLVWIQPPFAFRWLQDSGNDTNTTNNDNSTSSSSNSSSNTTSLNDGEVLRDTFTLYGSILIVVVILFCYVRIRFPRPFTIRRWQKDLYTPLADESYGFLSWIWNLQLLISEDEILDQCGLDSLCFLRALQMGYKLCCVGALNAIWLMPVYATAEEDSETADITDPILRVSVAHVPPESPRFIATVLAAYVLFGTTMYLILQEFEWFIEMRHKFLRKKVPRNYTVYVRNIPPEYRSNKGIKTFFQRCYGEDTVVQANLKVKTPQLAKLVQKRTTTVLQLENALAIKEIKGIEPTHKDGLLAATGKRVNSIEAYSKQLTDLNTDITQRIEKVQQKMADDTMPSSPLAGAQQQEPSETTYDDARQSEMTDASESSKASVLSKGLQETKAAFSEGRKALTSGVKSATSLAGNAVGSAVGGAVNIAGNAVNMVLGGEEDGEYYSGGFVSFSTLSTTNAARQMVHHSTPFEFETRQAPDPDDIFWANVGRTHADLQLGNLFSRAATAALCLFWTIPMAFISSLSSVEGLRQQFEFVDDMIEKFPFLEPILQQAAPFLIIVVNSLLPLILEVFSMMEGPISGSVVVASTFTKLSAFMIIQTFFVTAISGGIMEEIKNIIDDPLSAIDLLANSLPGQATLFMQLSFVGTVIFIAMENLRVVALVMALVRRCIGPRLTEKQRQTTFMGIRPLADPVDFQFEDNMSQICVLYFMIIFVYQTISPISSFILGFSFLILRPFCLHQFVYIYPIMPDSGGVIWTEFIKILLVCMLIAEFTIVGLMGLKKAAIATPLMIPLIIITILFNGYVRQEHFRVTECLPSKECLKIDEKNKQNGVDMDALLHDKYLQEELREKQVLPEDMSNEEAVVLGLLPEEEKDLEQNGLLANQEDPLALPPVDENNQAVNDEITISSSSSRSLLAKLFRKNDEKFE